MIQAKRAYVKESKGGKNWRKLLVLVVGIYLVWTLGRGVFELRLAYKRIDEARRVLASEQTKGEELKKKWIEVQTPEYVEKVARNDLNMQKEGETVVVMPKTQKLPPSRNATEGQGKNSKTREEESIDGPNWMKWWELVK